MLDAKKQSHRFFHAFCIRPELRFDTQEEGEQVILVLRKHPITQIFWVIISFVVLILLISLNFVFPKVFSLVQILYINLMTLTFLFGYIWLNVLLYIFNVGIVTNNRVLDMDFHNILYRETSETRLDKVEDITAKEGGYFGSFFNFGNVFVQTAGTEVNIEFISVPDPSNVVKIINEITHSTT